MTIKIFFRKLRVWFNSIKQYIWVVVALYTLHVVVEGFIVSVVFFKVLQPLYYTILV